MAGIIIPTHLTANSADSGSETLGNQTTASISPVTGSLIFVSVGSNKPSTTPNQPTISGLSLTWTAIRTQLSANNQLRITTFYAVANGNSGTLTISHGGQNQQNIYWTIEQLTYVNTGNSGANAIVQSSGNTAQNATNASVTLSSLNNSVNISLGSIYQNTSSSITPGSGFTTIGSYNPGIHGIQTEYQTNTPNVSWTIGSSANYVAVASEIKAQIAGGSFLFNLL